MRRLVINAGLALFLSAMLAGCGGSSSKANNTVTQVVVAPSAISLNSGDVAQITFTPENSAGTGIASPVTFTSSNPSIATVSTSGLICGGTWDANFVVCTGTVGGTPISGTATITATAGGVTSSGVTVSVHPKVSSVTIDPVIDPTVPGCTTTGLTNQLSTTFPNVHVCSTQATPHDAAAPCGPLAKDITSIAGPVSFASTDGSVVSIDGNNLATAHNPGIAGVFATVSGVSSPTSIFRTCMPTHIILHLNSDPAGTFTTSTSLAASQNVVVKADMIDEKGAGIGPAPVSIVSNNPVVASASSTTITGVAPGGAGVVAACIPPVCGNGLNTPIYSDLFQVTVTGSSPSSTVYATSSFAPPAGTTATAIPIDTGTNAVGTAINLSGAPNSMVFAGAGARAYLGTTGGLATLDPLTNQEVTVATGLVGGVIAVNPAGTVALVSNAVNNPATGNPFVSIDLQRLFIYNQTNNTLTTLVVPNAVAAAFSPDGFKAYILGTDNPTPPTAPSPRLYVFSPFFSLHTLSPAITTPTNVAFLASSDFAYVAGGTALKPFSVCNDVLGTTAPTATSAPQLVATTNNSDTIVAVNSTGLDITSVTIAPASVPADPVPLICPPKPTYAPPQFIDFGIGAFTARQLLVASNGSRVVVIPAGINKILTAVPGTPGATVITLPAGATEALSGALTNDGNTLWVGVAGTNTVDKIDLVAGADVLQIPTSFKQSDGTAAPPDIVTIRPK